MLLPLLRLFPVCQYLTCPNRDPTCRTTWLRDSIETPPTKRRAPNSYIDALELGALSKALLLCFKLQESRIAVVSSTAAATLRQLVMFVVAKVVAEDRMTEQRGWPGSGSQRCIRPLLYWRGIQWCSQPLLTSIVSSVPFDSKRISMGWSDARAHRSNMSSKNGLGLPPSY